MPERTLTANRDAARLDVFLSEEVDGLSRKKARELCERGEVRVNDRAGIAGGALRPGDQIVFADVARAAALPERVTPEQLSAFLVHFENERFLVVEKPRGMSSVRLRETDPVTLADLLAAHDIRCLTASPDEREAGLVQRLDYFTSGLVLAAKDREMWELLHTALLSGRIKKSYLALVEGTPKKKQFVIEHALAQSSDGKKMELAESADDADRTFTARTEVEMVAKFAHREKKLAVVRAQGARVRRHQIRIHLSASGHPLVGDALYGAKLLLGDVMDGREGFLLHAESIGFIDPVTGENRSFESESELIEQIIKRHSV